MEEDYYESRPDTWNPICLFEVVQHWRFVKKKPKNALDVTEVPYSEIEGWLKTMDN